MYDGDLFCSFNVPVDRVHLLSAGDDTPVRGIADHVPIKSDERCAAPAGRRSLPATFFGEPATFFHAFGNIMHRVAAVHLALVPLLSGAGDLDLAEGVYPVVGVTDHVDVGARVQVFPADAAEVETHGGDAVFDVTVSVGG